MAEFPGAPWVPQFWLGPAKAGMVIRFWADCQLIHLSAGGALRHTVASLLKDLCVPAGDGQAILGHTRISTTLEICTNVDEQARRDALTRLHGTFTTSRAESRGSRGR